MKKILLLLVLSVISVSSLAQVFSEEENERIDLALSYSDNGREDEAIAIYDELIKKHPDVSGLKFEKAYCYYQKQDYKNAYKTLKPTLSAPDANPQYFAVAGNAQDMMGKPKDALKTYQAGLEKFPDSGYLHLETGNVLIGLGYTAQGVGYYEHGIEEVDPGFASNYYRAAQYLFSDYPIKSIIYAETHNLIYDPNGPRWPEVSKLLYDAYNENIHFEADTVRTTFSRDRTITIDKKDVESGASPTSLLEQMSRIARELSFSDAMNESVDAEALKAAGGQLTLAELTAIRRRFLEHFEAKEQDRYPVFAVQRKVLDAGHWEAYNMFMLREGRPEEFKAWLQDHESDLLAYFEFMGAEDEE